MGAKKKERVVFYSKNDGASWPNLLLAEERLRAFSKDAEFDTRDILELYHIKLYFDNGLQHPSWNLDDIGSFKAVVADCWAVVKKFILEIGNGNITENLSKTGYDYNRSFWQLIEMLNVYKKVERETFALILQNFHRDIHIILSLPLLVKHFQNEIREFLLTYHETAELLIGNTEAREKDAHELHFPKSLTLADRERIISDYLDSPGANLNYVRLVVTSRDTPEFRLSPKVRLKAKKRAEELNQLIMEEGYTWSEGVEVAIAKDQAEPIKITRRGSTIVTSYSERYLDGHDGSIPLFNVFANLFHYTDQQGLIELVSHDSELDTLEKIMMKSKNEYVTGTAFLRKRYQSEMQLLLYAHYLKGRGLTIEQLIKDVIHALASHFEMGSLRFTMPSADSSYLEKIRTLAPELEFLLKQFQAFAEDGEIDFELLELQSNPTRFSEIPSLCEKKYIYANGNEITRLIYQFYSDQAFLHYVAPFEDKHRNLYRLLTIENVTINQFKSYQAGTVNALIDQGYLYITDEGYVKVKELAFVHLLGDLYKSEVLSYWNYGTSYRMAIDKMIADGLVAVENKLFTRQEQQYLNFYLNKKEFTNGLDLRNKYMHGTNSASESAQRNDYNVLLKIVILVLLKIKDDLVNHRYKIA